MDVSVRDWAKFYAELVPRVGIPWTATRDYSAERVAVRDLYVDLDEVFATIRARGSQPRTISVYADVVRISAASAIRLADNALLIVARLVIADGPTSVFLDFRTGPLARLALYTSAVQGNLSAKTLVAGQSDSAAAVFDLSGTQSPGVLVALAAGVPRAAPVPPIDDSWFQPGSPLRALLRGGLECSTALFESEAPTAGAILRWLVALTGAAAAAVDLNLQGGALLAQLLQSQVQFVPYLDRDVYRKLAESHLATAEAYEQQYERFADKREALENRKSAAGLMLQHYADLGALNDQLVAQGQGSLGGATKASLQARATLDIQRARTQEARIGFQYDAKIWVREQIIAAVLKMVVAVGEIVVAIALMAVGDEAAAPGAAAATGQAATAAAEVAEVAKTVEEVGQFAKLMAQLVDMMKKLQKPAEQIPKIVTAVTSLYTASTDITNAVDLASLTAPDASDIASQAEWDAFRLDIDSLLQPAVDAGVPGAEAYQLALRKLCIYGKAFMGSQVAVIKAAQELARLVLQRQVARRQEARLQDLLTKLGADADQAGELEQMFFERELDIKAWIYIALQNYLWAYRYWALRNSRVQLSMVKPVTDLRADLDTLTREWAAVLGSFNPPPEPFSGLSLVVADTADGLYGGAVARLRRDRAIRLSVLLDAAPFDGLQRVRLDEVRVWLQGVNGTDAHPVSIQITTSGQYGDRFDGAVFNFAASQTSREFRYAGPSGDSGQIRIHAAVAPREQDAYFAPTPFTDWIIKVSDAPTFAADLSGLQGIRIEFFGEAIPALKAQ